MNARQIGRLSSQDAQITSFKPAFRVIKKHLSNQNPEFDFTTQKLESHMELFRFFKS